MHNYNRDRQDDRAQAKVTGPAWLHRRQNNPIVMRTPNTSR